LKKYDSIVLFPDMLKKANEMLRKVGLAKQWANEKRPQLTAPASNWRFSA